MPSLFVAGLKRSLDDEESPIAWFSVEDDRRDRKVIDK